MNFTIIIQQYISLRYVLPSPTQNVLREAENVILGHIKFLTGKKFIITLKTVLSSNLFKSLLTILQTWQQVGYVTQIPHPCTLQPKPNILCHQLQLIMLYFDLLHDIWLFFFKFLLITCTWSWWGRKGIRNHWQK